MVICPVCKVSIPNWDEWRRHVLGEGRYPCPTRLCHRTFTTKAAANNHAESYHDGWRYVCLVCNGSYTDKSSFTKHRGRKPRCLTSVMNRLQIGPRNEVYEAPITVIAQEGPMVMMIPAIRVLPPVEVFQLVEAGKCFCIIFYDFNFF